MMKQGILAAGLVGVVALGIVLGWPEMPGSDLEYGSFRLAVSDQTCPGPDQPTKYEYLTAHCVRWKTHHDHCLCVTPYSDPLTGELTTAEYNALPDKYFRRVAVCEFEREGVNTREVVYGDVGQSPPPEWTCVSIAAKVPYWQAYGPLKSRLVDKLRENCCAGCSDDCSVTAISWGICPYCLLDGAGACDTLCISGG